MIFRQLFEDSSSTYTYLLACEDTGIAALIDPVFETVERDLEVLQAMGLRLTHTIETHVHADHLTGAKTLRSRAGSQVVYPAMDELPCADQGVREGEPFHLGNLVLHPLFTPGHTDHHHAYLIHQGGHTPMVFTGDALLIDGCGRTDFQSGDPAVLYRTIHSKLFNLPAETLVYPGHDYKGRCVSSIAQEKARNPRLGAGKAEAEFVEIMNTLDLPYPKRIDIAVPANGLCGDCPSDLPEALRARCPVGDQG